MTRRLGGARRTQFRSVLVVFLVHGMEGGAYTVLIADLARALELSDSTLGVALAILSASSAVGIPPAGRIADRLGRRVLLAAGALGVGCFYGALARVDTYQVLLVVLAFGGLAFSLLDLSPPTLGGDYERRYGREAMTRLYAGLDAAGAVGASPAASRSASALLPADVRDAGVAAVQHWHWRAASCRSRRTCRPNLSAKTAHFTRWEDRR
jgi:MFS family permease